MTEEIKQVETTYWVYTGIFFGLFMILTYCTLSITFIHSYEFSPGVLVSYRWTYNFIREWLIYLYVLIPLTGLLMITTKSVNARWVHVITLLLLIAWCVLLAVGDAHALSTANIAPSHKDFDASNPAHDKLYCCVYGGELESNQVCFINKSQCTPTSSSQLNTDGVFLLRFFVNLLFGILMVHDLINMFFVVMPAYNREKTSKSF